MEAGHPSLQKWQRPRWWEVAPEVVLIAGLTYFFVDEMDAATSAFKSVRAVTLMIATVIGWCAVRLILSRFVRWPAIRLAPLLIAAAVILVVVVVPAYRTHTVVEELRADPLAMPTPGTDTPQVTPDAPASTPATPQLLRTSNFRGIDHRANGTVSIYRRADGHHVIGLEHFEIQPGPDYDVYVVPGTDRTDRDNGTRIDDLRGNAGTQYYDVPDGLNLGTGPWTVLIWCQTFGVPVANASPV